MRLPRSESQPLPPSSSLADARAAIAPLYRRPEPEVLSALAAQAEPTAYERERVLERAGRPGRRRRGHAAHGGGLRARPRHRRGPETRRPGVQPRLPLLLRHAG